MPKFDIYATGPARSSRVLMNGVELAGVTDVALNLSATGPNLVTITFVASSINSSTAALKELLDK